MSKLRMVAPQVQKHIHILIFVFVLFVMGAFFGYMLVMALSIDQHQKLSGYLGNFLQLAIQGTVADIQPEFTDVYLNHVKWIILTWLFGLSVIGLPLIAVLDFLKGVLLGFTVGYLTTQMSWKGFLFAVLSILPANIFLIPALMICSSAGIAFAFRMMKQRLNMEPQNFKGPFRTLTLLHMVMASVMAVAAVLEVYLVPILVKWLAPIVV